MVPAQHTLLCLPECGERRPDRPSFVAHLLECTHISDSQRWFSQCPELPAGSPHPRQPRCSPSTTDDPVPGAPLVNKDAAGQLCSEPPPSSRCQSLCRASQPAQHSPRATPPQRKKAPPVGERRWDKYKDLIYSMYMKDKKTLQDLQYYMQCHHGFFATERQYRSQLTRWNFHKRIKREEIDYILQERARNKQSSSGQAGQFVKRRVGIAEMIPEETIRRWEAKTGGLFCLQAATESRAVRKPPDIDCVV
ncbi:hypothetical protein GQ53DRAFT_122088 [Thozetella sp. PMI_491]|nr:hypothetical protein GQ53DRAFT_122088 [Thozetella sp. PMI_491]